MPFVFIFLFPIAPAPVGPFKKLIINIVSDKELTGLYSGLLLPLSYMNILNVSSMVPF